jgi:hypothetical protein
MLVVEHVPMVEQMKHVEGALWSSVFWRPPPVFLHRHRPAQQPLRLHALSSTVPSALQAGKAACPPHSAKFARPNSSHVGSSSSRHPAGQQGAQRSGSLFTNRRHSMLGLPANGVAAGAGAAARRGAQADGCTNAGPQCQPAAAGGAGSSRAGRGAAASGGRGAGARPPGLPLLPAGEPLGCQRTGWVSLHQNKCRSAEPASS